MRLATGADVRPEGARCDECPLAQNPIVDGDGPEEADIVLVGEAPGQQEVRIGRPYVGRSGKLLDKALEDAGLHRGKVYVTNTVLCHPSDEEGGNRKPTTTEIFCCNQRLISEVLGRNPRVVVALGAVALNALEVSSSKAGDATISIQRGIARPWHPPRWWLEVKKRTGRRVWHRERGDASGIVLIPTWHPANVLRDPSHYEDLVRDLREARLLAEGVAGIVDPNVQYTVVRSLEELWRILGQGAWSRAGARVSLDVETAEDGRLLCIGLGVVGEQGLSGPVVIVPREVLEDDRFFASFDAWVEDKTVIGHNLKFDVRQLRGMGAKSLKIGGDTLLMAYASDSQAGSVRDERGRTVAKRGLKVLAQRLLHVRDWSAEVASYMHSRSLGSCPEDVLYEYNARDVAYTAELLCRLERDPSFDEDARWVYEHLLVPASNVLVRMEDTGARIDVDYLDRLERELRDDLKDEMDKLRGLVGPEISAVEADGKTFSPLSAAHVGELLYRHLDLPELSSAKRSLATDRATLTKLSSALRNHPDYARALEAIEIILSYRYTHKLLATYLVNIRKAMDAEGRLHFNFNLHTTSSGRLSSSDPINIQNWPKRRGTEIRDLFVATPGYTLVESDLSQAEIRVAAALSGDPALISVVAAGGDMHRNNAAKIFQKKPEDVTESERQLGKAVSFAVLYGADAPKVSEITRLPLSQAEEVIKSFFSAYPRLSEWIAEVERRVKNGEPVVTPFHRRRRVDWLPESGKERGDVIRSVVNFPVQSTASDITLSALIRIGREIDWQRTRLLITVHDSILAETMDDPVEVGGWLAATMVSCSPFPDVPFEAEVKVGERWGSLHELKSR